MPISKSGKFIVKSTSKVVSPGNFIKMTATGKSAIVSAKIVPPTMGSSNFGGVKITTK